MEAESVNLSCHRVHGNALTQLYCYENPRVGVRARVVAHSGKGRPLRLRRRLSTSATTGLACTVDCWCLFDSDLLHDVGIINKINANGVTRRKSLGKHFVGQRVQDTALNRTT